MGACLNLSKTKAIGEDLLFSQVEKLSCSRSPGSCQTVTAARIAFSSELSAFLRRGEERRWLFWC